MNILYKFSCIVLVVSPLQAFRFTSQDITPEIQSRMVYTWQNDSPVPLEDLRYITLSHYDFDGKENWGSWWFIKRR